MAPEKQKQRATAVGSGDWLGHRLLFETQSNDISNKLNAGYEQAASDKHENIVMNKRMVVKPAHISNKISARHRIRLGDNLGVGTNRNKSDGKADKKQSYKLRDGVSDSHKM